MGDDVILVDDKGRDGAALYDLIQGALLADEFYFDFARAPVSPFDDGGEAVHHPAQEFARVVRAFVKLLQFPVGFDLDLFGHQGVPDGSRLEMVDQSHGGRLGVPDGFDDGMAVGQLQKGFQTLQSVEFRVIGKRGNAKGPGMPDPDGVLVDVGDPQDLRPMPGEGVVQQEFQKRFAGPAASDDGNGGTQDLADHGTLVLKSLLTTKYAKYAKSALVVSWPAFSRLSRIS